LLAQQKKKRVVQHKRESTASSSINSVDIIASFARRAIEQFRSL
jgi:hypothetical protein